MVAGTSRAWLRWLHRIGYATTAIVLLEVVLILGVLFNGFVRDQRTRADLMDRSRTRAGPLLVPDPRYRPDELDLLSAVPSLPPEPAIGARFAAMPYLRGDHFAISVELQPGAARAKGVLVAFGPEEKPRYRATFSLPAKDMKVFVDQLDARTKGWPGDASLCLDGTGVAFELRTARGIRSGAGNSACSAHYRQVGALFLGLVSSVLPASDRPVDGEWYPPESR